MRKAPCALILILIGALQTPTIGRAGEITAEGHKLAKFLDGMDVKHLWLAKHAVKWETGEPLDKPITDGKAHTHCSAFVAAA